MQHWHSFLYGYGVGGLLFALPIAVALKKGAIRADVPAERRLLVGLVVTYLAYMTTHGVWNALAIRSF